MIFPVVPSYPPVPSPQSPVPIIQSHTPCPMYRQLDDDRIIETLQRLRDRISERFPGSSLSRVSEELLTVARESASHVAYLAKPNWTVRISVAAAIVVMLAVLAAAVSQIRLNTGVAGWPEFVQAVDSAINDLVFIGIAIFF